MVPDVADFKFHVSLLSTRLLAHHRYSCEGIYSTFKYKGQPAPETVQFPVVGRSVNPEKSAACVGKTQECSQCCGTTTPSGNWCGVGLSERAGVHAFAVALSRRINSRMEAVR